MKVAQAGVSATAKIKFFESMWKASFPGSIQSITDVAKLLTSAVSDSIDAYNKGQVNNLVKTVITANLSTQVRGYFSQGPDVMPCPDIKI